MLIVLARPTTNQIAPPLADTVPTSRYHHQRHRPSANYSAASLTENETKKKRQSKREFRNDNASVTLCRALNDWTSLSVICFGVCELSIRCQYSQQQPRKDCISSCTKVLLGLEKEKMSAFPIQCNVKHATGARNAITRRQLSEPHEKRTDVEAMARMTTYAERPETHVRHSSADSCIANKSGSGQPFQHPQKMMYDLKPVDSVQQNFHQPFTFWRSMSVDHRSIHAAIQLTSATSPSNPVTYENGAGHAVKGALKSTNVSPMPGSDSFDVNSNVFLNKFRSTTFVPA